MQMHLIVSKQTESGNRFKQRKKERKSERQIESQREKGRKSEYKTEKNRDTEILCKISLITGNQKKMTSVN